MSPLFSSFSTMKSILLLLHLIVTVYTLEEVDISGKVVCKDHNGSIVPVKDVVVELLEWNRLPLPPHGYLLRTMKTGSSGEFRLIGRYYSPFELKFYIQYFYMCDNGGIRSVCPFIDEKCGKSTKGYHHQRIGDTLDKKCTYNPPHK
ncbi:hypothetical protein PFISCL1PPCAC_21669, partial [Pristionchus fissidentatus]